MKKSKPSLEFQYRFSQGLVYVRLTRTAWRNGQFEVLTPDEFDQLKKWLRRFSIAIHEAEA